MSSGEWRARLDGVRRAMTEQGLDLVVVGPSANLRYLLGFNAMAVERITVLLVSHEGAVMVLPDFDADEFGAETGFDEVALWNDKRGPAEAVESAFSRLGLPADPAVAVDDELPFLFLTHLRERLGTRPPALAGPLFGRLRLVKSEREVEAIARAGELVSRGLDVAVERMRPGMTERQLAAIVDAEMRAGGSESVDFVIVAAGAGAAAPHHQPAHVEFRAGEPVLVDIAVRLDGYYADITGQGFLGDPPEDYVRAYEVVHAAQEAGVRASRAGASAHDVDAAATKVIVDAGLGEWSGPRTGHGIGLDVHEPPSVVEGNDDPLPPGAVITVEPGVYLPGRYGIRIEDTVLVTEGEPRRLTRGSRPLAVVAAR